MFSHATRESITIIIGELFTVTVFAQECLVSNTPGYLLDILNGAENIEGSGEALLLAEDDLQKEFSFLLHIGSMSTKDIASLPASMQTICENKEIEMTKTVNTTEEIYNSTFINVSEIEPCPLPTNTTTCLTKVSLQSFIVKRLGLGLGTWDLGPGTWDLGPGTDLKLT